MPIVNSTHEESTNLDGSRQVIERHYDQEGAEYMISWHAAVGVDIATVMNARVAGLNEQLAQSEFEQIVGQA